MKLRCLFGHKWLYTKGYGRICKNCKYERPGWGSKQLNAGDKFNLLDMKSDEIVNPDDFRRKK